MDRFTIMAPLSHRNGRDHEIRPSQRLNANDSTRLITVKAKSKPKHQNPSISKPPANALGNSTFLLDDSLQLPLVYEP
ncbi:hypothetical protein Nepgr_011769 [Nepenthes gracilis]|uniref:Uncharacterized protein n=1 Tax=Nepenthes gracilis TaxID=150966 RepID=A0AAD3XM77_NEPGR|nr:hypothetical protein Nepgr_011769 [Nepenthes gracilis]